MKRPLYAILILSTTTCLLGEQWKNKIGQQEGIKLVRHWVSQVRGSEGGRIAPVVDDSVSNALPSESFFVLSYPQYPVARALPESLKFNNLVLVNPDGKVELLSDINALESLFQSTLLPVKSGIQAEIAIRAWLRLTQEFHQDGFFRFSIPEQPVALTRGKTGIRITGQAVVTPDGGNKGQIVATLNFDRTGKLVKVLEAANVIAGPRPICQVTKLLDPDPVVRGMAEQTLLVMGRAAKEYLDEERRKASPELQQAIDRIWQRILKEGR